ncbi:hypothetical protein FQR65_LT10778 [Abscondita terminalis]|nr:hypothetical protein FQR65_LT10778 [Abscondita terminalis]
MSISEDLKNRLKFVNTCSITDDAFKKLVDNTFSILGEKPEVHGMSTLYNSKPDLVKQVHATMLRTGAECARNDFNHDDIENILVECNWNPNRIKVFVNSYDIHKRDMQILLGNIGSHPPHVVGADWKIDYIVKESNLDQSDGPIFRISLITSKYDEHEGKRKAEPINFSCNSQELQDLVYKLKDAVRHCQRLTTD